MLPDVEHPAGHSGVDPLKPGEPTGRVKVGLDGLEVRGHLHPPQGIRGPAQWVITRRMTPPYLVMQGNLTTGPLVMPSYVTLVVTPQPLRAEQPRLVLATRQPSVVAMGTWAQVCKPGTTTPPGLTWTHLPSRLSGPTTPTGTGMYPITFSQHAPRTFS